MKALSGVKIVKRELYECVWRCKMK